MQRFCAIVVFLLLTTTTCLASISFRLGGGVDVFPLKFGDLRHYNTGVGGDLRADIVWGVFSTTTLEMGYREFSYDGIWADRDFKLHRFGFIQRFYPFCFTHPKLGAYLGLGLTISNQDEFSLNIASADYGGWIVTIGKEIPLNARLRLDPAIRWDFWASTDYFYSGFGLNVHLTWLIR